MLRTARYAAALLLLSLVLAPVFAAGNLQVAGYTVAGGDVLVGLTNSGSSSTSGVIKVVAVVDGTQVTQTVPVTVERGGTATAAVGFGFQVDNVITVGVTTDDPTPF